MIEEFLNRIHCVDAIKGMEGLPEKCVNTIVTSVPYWNLRDYGVAGQYGLEDTPEQFIEVMVKVFREARRVLRDDGTLWLNIGDSYAAQQKKRTKNQAVKSSRLQGSLETQASGAVQKNKIVGGLKAKDLVGIPWMLAFALRADGWFLRQDIIWNKPNPMPESVTDRCTKSHEYIFLMSKSKRYFFDAHAISTPVADKTMTTYGSKVRGYGDGTGLIASENWANSMEIRKPKDWGKKYAWGRAIDGSINDVRKGYGEDIRKAKSGNKARKSGSERDAPENNGISNLSSHVPWEGLMANKRSVWTISTNPFKEAHFATFPEELPATCIKAGCPIDGIVLDMFMGAGTTAVVARKLQRNFIGFELKMQYKEMADIRLQNELGLFRY